MIVKNFLGDKFCSVEGIDINPSTAVGQDEPLMIISDGSCLISIAVHIDGLKMLEVIDVVVIAVDVEILIVIDNKQPLSIGCDVHSIS